MHKDISSPDYIDSFQFDHVDTYSFQRGIEYEAFIETIGEEFNSLERKKHGDNLSFDDRKRYAELLRVLKGTQFLIDTKNEFHPSSIKISSFKRSEPRAETLIKILKTKIEEIPRWMCLPTFRDGLVFYDKNHQVVSVLNVCLECEYLAIEPSVYLNADFKTYHLLRQFFIDCGHKIETNRN